MATWGFRRISASQLTHSLSTLLRNTRYSSIWMAYVDGILWVLRTEVPVNTRTVTYQGSRDLYCAHMPTTWLIGSIRFRPPGPWLRGYEVLKAAGEAIFSRRWNFDKFLLCAHGCSHKQALDASNPTKHPQDLHTTLAHNPFGMESTNIVFSTESQREVR